MIYPNGKDVAIGYNGNVDSKISRVSIMNDGIYEEDYSYLGLDTYVRISRHTQGAAVNLTYIKQGAEPVGDAGDQYTGLDRFGRIVDQRWIRASDSATLDRYQ